MKATKPSKASIQADQLASPFWDTPTRLFRLGLSIPLFFIQLPLVVLDTLISGKYYGRPNWSFLERAVRLIGAYVLWSLHVGTRPPGDVVSYAARSSPGRLSGKKRAKLVNVPARPDKLFGDAVYEKTVTPEKCPCFWQWLEGDMVSPLEDTMPVEQRKVMMYFVGGGMVQGHPCDGLISWRMVQATGVPLFGVNFRKCVTKETAFPAALQDAVAALYYLLDEGYRAENISISGDSGGACIVITMLLYLQRYQLEVPECAVLISPFVDLVDDFMGDEELLNLDFLNPEMLVTVEHQYTENRPDLRATLLSPALNELPHGYTFKRFPRSLISYGDAEMFTPSIIDMIKILKAAGVKVQVDIGKDQVHNYPYYLHDQSETGFYGQLKPFLSGQGRYESC